MSVSLESITRPTRDVLQAAAMLDGNEIRYLVDSYYQVQKLRTGSANQVRSIDQRADAGPPSHETLTWLRDQFETIENQIKRALDVYSLAHVAGPWLRSVYGIGPVIAAGLLAHIDITKAPTVGHIWRFAGIDPSMTWEKGQKRPHNAKLKTLCWKTSDSFVKASGQAECVYGSLYRERKAYELARNDAGGNAERAAAEIAKRPTHAQRAIYATGRLPPGHIDARARRYAVKQFLSDFHAVWYELHFGKKPPLPYPIAILGHTHLRVPQT